MAATPFITIKDLCPNGIGAAFLLRSEEILEVVDESKVEFL